MGVIPSKPKNGDSKQDEQHRVTKKISIKTEREQDAEFRRPINYDTLLFWNNELDARRRHVPKYEEDIRNKIRRVFVNYINPDNVLHYFHAINTRVLTQNDIERVQATTNEKGSSTGAGELIACLPHYEGWFDCLLAVLRLPNVNLDHVAQMMEEAVAAPENH